MVDLILNLVKDYQVLGGLEIVLINNRYMPEYADELDILDNYSLFKNNQLGIFICNAIFEKEFSNYGLVNFPSVEGGKQNF